MLIVISDSDFKPGEAQLVNQLFQNGLDLFHIRKYGADEESLLKLTDQIDLKYHSKLVLHHDHEWGRSIGLKRFHYSEKDRLNWKQQGWFGVSGEYVYSTSVHGIEEYNALPDHFSYVFLSPVFDSISKSDYKGVKFDLEQRRNYKAKLIGLGGIRQENIQEVIQMGFDGAALLGAIWNSDNPLDEIKRCRYAINRVPTKSIDVIE